MKLERNCSSNADDSSASTSSAEKVMVENKAKASAVMGEGGGGGSGDGGGGGVGGGGSGGFGGGHVPVRTKPPNTAPFSLTYLYVLRSTLSNQHTQRRPLGAAALGHRPVHGKWLSTKCAQAYAPSAVWHCSGPPSAAQVSGSTRTYQ